MKEEETIAAISTPLGKSGIGIVRLSGQKALDIAGKLFTSPDRVDLTEVESHTLHYGYIRDPDKEREIDEVLLSVMKAPHTYTREDVVEINCHGGVVPLRETLELALNAGARPAEPGEFTKRAFLNGRLTLDQAKSVKDIVDSKTRFSLELSLDRLEGKFSSLLSSVRENLTSILAEIETMINYPDYEESIVSRSELEERLSDLEERIEDFLANSKDGKILKEGHKIAILGRPNVGKSTLLNTLLREERAIVSPTPGTTRDTLEEELEIDGIPFLITDTAGIRKTEGEIEKKGVRRAKEQGQKADISLLLIDVNTGIEPEDHDIAEEVDEEKTILVLNKIDLVDNLPEQEIITKMGSGWADVVNLSAEEGRGLKALESSITGLVWGGKVRKDESLVLLNVREKELLKQAKESLASARQALCEGRSIDLVEFDIREARKDLGALLGEDLTEEILNRVFSDFCVGK
ncbi:tRNA uridine-5-carboxymethylaminomethyl(34) synthesis GTPase MnmE [Candidatus Bipolaricaulota bacterium]|nr:tRNA uridine-5-carboxymethylaminomethyl(34) synthesis GTPase MnmE [Candidatus Bipolaricaulota bacterium]